jgi:hypothetical protein
MTLVYVTDLACLLGDMAFHKSLEMRSPFIPQEVVSLADPHFGSPVALEMLLGQMPYLQSNGRTAAIREPEFAELHVSGPPSRLRDRFGQR